jgi:hypothetical protein
MIALLLANLPLVLSLLGGAGGLAALLVKFGARRVAGWIGQHRELIVLVAIVAVAAFFWLQAQRARAERDGVAAWANLACAKAAGSFDGAGGKGSAACLDAIGDLAAFKAKSVADTAQALKDHLDEQTTKTAADAASARRDAARAQAAAHELEKANAAIGPDDRVGSAWLRAFNDAAGLR